jgi:hypothetical protein
VLSKRFHLEFPDIYACGNSDKKPIRQAALRNCVETMLRTSVWYKMSPIRDLKKYITKDHQGGLVTIYSLCNNFKISFSFLAIYDLEGSKAWKLYY